jgi:hypothetical protein
MALSEGAWITFALGFVSLCFVVSNLLGRMPAHQPVAVPQTTSLPVQPFTPASVPLDPISAEEQRAELEAKLEIAYRETWIKEWEEEELKRQFREGVYTQEAQWQEQENEKFEEDQMLLLQLTKQQEAIENYLSRNGHLY